MIAQSFQYESPGTIAEAISLLQKYGDEAKILSGGHSLIPMMKLRFASPGYLIDINNIKGLSHINEENGIKVPLRDDNALAEALLKIIRGERKFNPQTIRDSVIKKYGTADCRCWMIL